MSLCTITIIESKKIWSVRYGFENDAKYLTAVQQKNYIIIDVLHYYWYFFWTRKYSVHAVVPMRVFKGSNGSLC